MIDRPRPARRVVTLAACFVAILAGAGCKKTFDDPITDAAGPATDGAPGTDAAVDGPTVCNKANPAPTYTELYDKYFAVDTPGHCATTGGACHGDPDHNVWLCGTTKDSCYNGMVTEGLINQANPILSKIGDPKTSPLKWVNSDSGFMPADTPTPMSFPEGRDAIIAWVGACAQNN